MNVTKMRHANARRWAECNHRPVMLPWPQRSTLDHLAVLSMHRIIDAQTHWQRTLKALGAVQPGYITYQVV